MRPFTFFAFSSLRISRFSFIGYYVHPPCILPLPPFCRRLQARDRERERMCGAAVWLWKRQGPTNCTSFADRLYHSPASQLRPLLRRLSLSTYLKLSLFLLRVPSSTEEVPSSQIVAVTAPLRRKTHDVLLPLHCATSLQALFFFFFFLCVHLPKQCVRFRLLIRTVSLTPSHVFFSPLPLSLLLTFLLVRAFLSSCRQAHTSPPRSAHVCPSKRKH